MQIEKILTDYSSNIKSQWLFSGTGLLTDKQELQAQDFLHISLMLYSCQVLAVYIHVLYKSDVLKLRINCDSVNSVD